MEELSTPRWLARQGCRPLKVLSLVEVLREISTGLPPGSELNVDRPAISGSIATGERFATEL